MKNKYLRLFSKFGVLFCFYVVLGIIFTYPLVTNFTNSVPNNMFVEADHTYEWGDHLQIIAGFREHKNYLENITSGEPLLDKEFCFDTLESCQLSSFQVLKNVVFSPYWMHTFLNIFFDDPVVYNLSILLSFPLVGIIAYLFVDFVLKNHFKFNFNQSIRFLISMLSSLFVVLAPIRIHHLLVGHKNGYMIAVMVAVFLMLEYFLFSRKKQYLIVLGILFTFLAFSEQFFVYWGLVYIGIRILYEEIPKNWSKLFTPDLGNILLNWIKDYWSIGLTVLIAVWVNLAGKVAEISNSDLSGGRLFSLIEFYSPPGFSYLWSLNILEHEHNVYIGLLGLLILFMGIGFIVRNYKKPNRFLFLSVILALFFLLVSLGSLTPLYKVLYDYLPGFGLSRTPVRALFIFFPLLSIIFAYVVGKLIHELKYKYQLLTLFLFFVAIFINFKSPLPISLTGLPETIDIPNNEKILFVPIAEAGHFYNSVYEFQISGANSLMINGYHPYRMNRVMDFENNYAGQINQSAINGENIELEYSELLDSLNIDRVIILPNYLNDDRIEKLK